MCFDFVVLVLDKNSFIKGGTAAVSPARGGATAARGTFQKHAVDHRPSKLLVSGYEADESDSVLAHFAVSFFYFFDVTPFYKR